MLKCLTLWFADLWPAECIACIYQRFFVLGLVSGITLSHVLIYAVIR